MLTLGQHGGTVKDKTLAEVSDFAEACGCNSSV
jgi:hypothetical protein